MMDDTFADESGIPVLANLDDIPVHSTPIKGTKVPLPSTGPIMKIMHDKGKYATLAEQEISELPNIPEERSTSNRLHPGQGHKLTHVPTKDDRKKAAEFHITQRQNNYSEPSRDKHKPSNNDSTLRNTNTVNDDEKLYKADSHFVRQSALDSDSRFQSSEGLYLRYNCEDNLRSHGHSKQSRSHVPYGDSSKNNTSGQQKKESREANSDKSDTETNSGQTTDNVKGSEGSRTLSKYTPDTNSNAFSSYAFSEKEMARRSLRQTRRQLEMTPENNPADFESVDGKRSPRFKVSSSGRFNDRTADVSPLARRARMVQDAKGFESSTGAARSLSTSVKQASYSEVEVSTIHKQRQEIQLLVTELKDRDRELGDMMKSHEQQLMAWEQDRHRVISLNQKCSQYEGDLQSKTAQLRSALMAVKDYKSKYTSQSEEMEVSKSAAERLIQENQNFKQQLTECEDKCGLLQKSVQDLSNTVGRLQAREEELNTSLKLKEKDMISATSQMKELSDRLRQLDVRCKECQDREKQAVKERNDWQQKYEDRLTELQSLTNAVDGKSKEVSQLEEEICSLRHHLSVLQKDATMREQCQNEVIESMKEKQERTDTQLKSFRELYERQLRELSKLQLQVDTSKDFISKQCSLEEQRLSGSFSTKGNSRLSDMSPNIPRNTQVQTSRYRDGDILIHIDRDRNMLSLQQNTHTSGYQTQVSGNSRLSERSPDRQRNTLAQTNRHRDSDIDMHSLQQHTQSSGYQTQVSGNSRLLERSPDRQRNTLVQTNRHRDSDIDMHSLQQHTQSSGYQTQVSGNQSELLEPQSTAGTHLQFITGRTVQNQEQVQMGYQTNDDYAKFSKIMTMQSSINAGALQKKEGTSLEDHSSIKPEIIPKNVRYKDEGRISPYTIGATKQFPFSEGAHTNPGINRSSDSERRDNNQYSPGIAQAELPSVHPTRTQTLPYSTCDSPPREGGYVIEQQRADNRQTMNPDCDKHKEKHETNNVAAGRQASIQEGASIPPPYNNAYMFENRLCSFLEDMEDIDDNIWDDKGNVSRVIPEVEASPTHKLQKLLLESKMMINELVKTTESPVSKQVQPPEIEENKKK